jgi:hypothetical protein
MALAAVAADYRCCNAGKWTVTPYIESSMCKKGAIGHPQQLQLLGSCAGRFGLLVGFCRLVPTATVYCTLTTAFVAMLTA